VFSEKKALFMFEKIDVCILSKVYKHKVC